MEKFRFYLLLPMLCLFVVQIQAQKNVDFIKKNASEISIDFNNENFDDLHDLEKKIGNASVVLLGEETHGDGTTMQAKGRIIKYLHEKMGFNILAFESSLYNAERAWDVAHWDKNPENCIQNSTFELWGHTQQFLPLAKYIASSIKTNKPLRVTGFDAQLHGYFLKRDLAMDFMTFLKQYKIPFYNQEQQNTFYKVYNKLVYGLSKNQSAMELERSDIQEKLPAFKELLDQKIQEISALPIDDVTSQWKQFWISTRLYLPFILVDKQIEKAAPPNSATIRDSLMAENLTWLVNERFAKEKIIVWAASSHIGRSPDQNKQFSDGVHPTVMGDYIRNKLGSKIYSICFTAYDGEWAWYNMPIPHRINLPSKDSFEEIFKRARFNNAFMDFKHNRLSSGGQWLVEKRNMRPYGYKEFSRSWPSIFDAVIFNKTMVRAVSMQAK